MFYISALTNPSGTRFALSNKFDDETVLREDISECRNETEIAYVLNRHARYGHWLFSHSSRDDEHCMRFTQRDALGNVSYIIIGRKIEDPTTQKINVGNGYLFLKTSHSNDNNVAISIMFDATGNEDDAMPCAKIKAKCNGSDNCITINGYTAQNSYPKFSYSFF